MLGFGLSPPLPKIHYSVFFVGPEISKTGNPVPDNPNVELSTETSTADDLAVLVADDFGGDEKVFPISLGGLHQLTDYVEDALFEIREASSLAKLRPGSRHAIQFSGGNRARAKAN